MKNKLGYKTAIILPLIVAALWPLASGAQTDKRPATSPQTMREDFQHDSLGQFASYPPAQDVGYEPSLTPTTGYDAPGGRALMRVWKPNRAGALRFGFIRQTSLVTNDDAKMALAYRLNHAAPNDSLEIGVAGADGCRYVKRIPAQTKGWNKADIPLTEFRCANGQALKSGVGIEAVYIVADLKRADADITYRFIIDDVTLSAVRIESIESEGESDCAARAERWRSPATLFQRERPREAGRAHAPSADGEALGAFADRREEHACNRRSGARRPSLRNVG